MIRKILILAMIISSLVVSGCDPQQQPPQPPQDTTPTTQPDKTTTENPRVEKPVPPPNPDNQNAEPPKIVKAANQDKAKKINVKVYYPDDAGINLVAVNRTVEIKAEEDKYLAAVNLLITYPKEKDLTTIFPKNAKINSVQVREDTAFVDLDKNIRKSFVGGSTGEEMLINSIVKTLTEFKEIKQVRFLIDGEEIETLSGHMDLSEPVKKSDT